MSFDIVITWVDWSNKEFVEKLKNAGGRSEGCENGNFLELKYLLRSLNKFEVNYRMIYVVHSDNHPPPTYLKETNQLKFVPHSALVTDPSHLPLVHRESICAHLHRIPDLLQHYFYLQDDLFVMNKGIFEKIIEMYQKKKIYTFRRTIRNRYDVQKSCGLWYQTTSNSSRIINNVDSGNMIIFEHAVQFFDKEIMLEIERKYQKNFVATCSYQNQKAEKYKELDIIDATCMFSNYLVNHMGFSELSVSKDFFCMIHTNGYTDQTDLTFLKDKLHQSQNAYVLNAQGNGISDEYPKCETVRNLFYNFLDKTFPVKTENEVEKKKKKKKKKKKALSFS